MFFKILLWISILQFYVNGLNNNIDCDNEESEVEYCAQQFLLIGRQRMPQTITEVDIFCKNYKIQDNCLRNHSLKCLSPSAHQTVTILINSVVAQNEKICNDWRYKKRITNAAKCYNRYESASNKCLTQFIAQIQGIHQLGQTDKIPIICCNYHKYRTCTSNSLSINGNACNKNAVKTINSMVDGYSGDVINYVCEEYSQTQKCTQITGFGAIQSINSTEEIPKNFFSLMVKIYLS